MLLKIISAIQFSHRLITQKYTEKAESIKYAPTVNFKNIIFNILSENFFYEKKKKHIAQI